MPDKKMKVLDDVEAARELGLPLTEEELAAFTPVPDPDAPAPSPVPVSTAPEKLNQEQQDTQEKQTQEKQTQEKQPSEQQPISEEERRRQWQSKADKAEQERLRLAQENEILRQIALQNRVIQQQVLGGAQTPSPVQPEAVKEPLLSDYIDDDYDAQSAFDGRTKSGRAYQKYMADREQYILTQAETRAEQRVFSKLQQNEQQKLVIARAARLIEKYPQFRDTLTGQPDYERIKQELFESSGNDPDDWVTLADIRLGKKQETTKGSPASDVIEQIERNAQQPQSVVSIPSAPPVAPVEISDEDKAMIAVFGDSWVIPRNS